MFISEQAKATSALALNAQEIRVALGKVKLDLNFKNNSRLDDLDGDNTLEMPQNHTNTF